MKVLALDFDGVIADSQMECLFVGFNTYSEFNRGTKLFDGKKFTFDNFDILVAKHKGTVGKYKILRPYVIDAFCYYVIPHIIENRINVKNQEQYKNIREKLMQNIHKEFIEFFYRQRQSLIDADIEKWVGLMEPFGKIVEATKKLQNNFIFAVATNNRMFVVQAFIKKFGIAPSIITDCSLSVDKKIHINKLKSELGVGYSDIYFVDDQIKNFIDILPLGVKCYLATWGYNTKEQLEEAKKIGAVLLKEDDFYKTFVKYSLK